MALPVNISDDSLTTIVGNKGSELLGLTLINNVDFYMGVEKHELSYSDVWIGFSDKTQEANSKFDINDPPNALESGSIIFATNVHNTLDTLPAIDKHYTYRILPSQGSLDNASGLKSGIIKLNLSNSNSMFVKLVTNENHVYKKENGNLTDFYGGGLELTRYASPENYKGSINGRFIGENAEGVITIYNLNTDQVDTTITGVALFDRNTTYPLPAIKSFGYVFAQKDSQAYGGGFVGMPEDIKEGVGVNVEGSEGISVANPNISLINSFDFIIGTRLVELPYSTIYVGGSTQLGSSLDFKINGQEELLYEGGIVFATNVHNTIDTLPTLDQDYTYSLLSGVLAANGLDTGNMQVNFSTGLMNVSLGASSYGSYDGQGNVAQFYDDSISLKSASNELLKGSITGRFVGLNAEGALTFYSLDSGSTDPVTGVGFFDRTGVILP